MIKSFETIDKEIEYAIIPHLKSIKDISLSQNDTLVVFWDYNQYRTEEGKIIYDMFQEIFPYNSIIIVPKGTELGVIKNEI